ncbi:MAG: hypothetical protein JO283_19675 [Bradyrhizobium sp.]|nr:hypothetical protein [Bradyrhizobium sp.]
MLRKAILALLALIVIGLAGAACAAAHGGAAGDFPAVGYPFLFSLNYQPNCHLYQRRVMTRHGWRLCLARVCGQVIFCGRPRADMPE